MGGFHQDQWFAEPWPQKLKGTALVKNLTLLELLPILAAVMLWGNRLQNKSITFWCDNQSVVNVVNKQTATSVPVLNVLRELILQCLRFNIWFRAKHVPGVENNIADALSRLQLDKFRHLNRFRQLIVLMADSLSHTTLKIYSRVWAEWIANTDAEKGLKDHQSRILATFSYLLKLKKTGICGSTVQKNMAALSFLFNLFSWKDVTKEFLIKRIVKGWKIKTAAPDKRKPVSFETLNKLLKVVPNVCRDKYETILFKTAFSLAFFGAFRIGELVSPSRTKPGGLNIRDVKILGQSVSLNIRYSKTDKSTKGKHSLLTAIGGNCCPVKLTTQYLYIRKNNQGPFLIHEDGSYVSRYQFLVIFRACLKAISLCPESFCTHSFRIGAATEASQLGFHEDRIKRLGRWSSNCFKSYIRPHLSTSSTIV
ncbi:hypothetical protein XELAEV_18042201mg [Xenopus laevis]|uniref:Tyr recombinase domain-containing protein n=1 Tax=Xenopus laevis TaxID=8355 RepID=A0A974C3L8_XENLA|nr:hypothetical protein XELAEV_18042201mg [Xenopus laevis]